VLRAFLGLVGYYQRFIKGYDTIAAPCTALLCRDVFHRNAEVEAMFRAK
jgi:hypothetical protein